MKKQCFCPFINSKCRDDCMFYTISNTECADMVYRNCYIAKGINNIPDRLDEMYDELIKTINHHSK